MIIYLCSITSYFLLCCSHSLKYLVHAAYSINLHSIIIFVENYYYADMSSTAFIEPLPVIDFVQQLLNRDVSSRPLSDADRVKVRLFDAFLELVFCCTLLVVEQI